LAVTTVCRLLVSGDALSVKVILRWRDVTVSADHDDDDCRIANVCMQDVLF